ncbi:conserved Plasmodium protein, unknown function [Plasmodium knowlesi strain H]|uniref:Alpha/beta hydrolase n=3 Tax=Plasmodium knowlesi TaxID=5850 RepID=A0A5K1V9S4_PLAKH|nr:conserved Plasmodium protein, unknown function [Plasmodium knowlesi strain H]OTN64522.1 Uncharacterized protein PKNOH_S130185600 [Plasmodium knowlesi]CAA9989022.1 conserved Plasmodium protein, unknown function [Plasmodium knowlesi strain H]SBO24866.1 conserved Plasmodium protein, unknown function [Plasmodium knowlesi strain H]SBO27554.1 conserved Plasmodium protein, unknown function [Plasmodium knowlesi strain H]VVS78496.1 conserved Plasmodium protein, unknown function [Plasmodium knowlesi |eukprot:XP_002261370.1 hypothetical protein, conserved in Plasmodium species [Plasmodium knowlesi strain H]
MFCKEKYLENYKKKKNRLREVTRRCLNLIDSNYQHLTSLIRKNNTGNLLTSYQFSDDEIKFDSDENIQSSDIYFPESTYTNNDFKNLLGWVPRNLVVTEPVTTDSIPCAFFFSKNDDKISTENKIILYLHKFNEDLGTIIPTVNALHQKLKMNIIAMEYSGYGVSFDTYEQKLVSIVNDSFTLLKFIINFLKIPCRNIYILCYDFLASCAIEVVNRYEDTYGKMDSLGGLVLIKPQLLHVVSHDSVTSPCEQDDNIVLEGEHSIGVVGRIKSFPGNCTDNTLDEAAPVGGDDSHFEDVPLSDGEAKKESYYAVSNKSKQKNCTVMTPNELYHSPEFKKDEEETNNVTRNSVKKNNSSKKGFLTIRSNVCNRTWKGSSVGTNSYQFANGIITCDMSLFYSHSEPSPPGKGNNNISNSLMKRILKDTFDIEHSINSIKSISCPILIFHAENYSYKNSSSYILLDSAEESHKKAAFSFDFMNEDFVMAFKWFFSETINSQRQEKLLKNLLYSYEHPSYDMKDNVGTSVGVEKQRNSQIDNEHRENTHSDLDEMCSGSFDSTCGEMADKNFNVPLNSSVRNSFILQKGNLNDALSDSEDSPKCDTPSCSPSNSRSTINLPGEIFICPEMVQEEIHCKEAADVGC